MNIKSKLKAILVFPLIGIAISIMAFSCSSPSDADNKLNTEKEENVEAIRVLELKHIPVSRKVTQTAHLMPNKEIFLASATPGRIQRIYVDAGSKVSTGQLLVEMDQSQLKQAQVQLKGLKRDFQRIDTLRQVGSATQQQYDQLKTQYEVLKTNVKFLEDNTKLLAPFAGTVSAKYFEDGEMFSGAPNTQVGKAAILTLLQTSRLKANVNMPERFYPSIKPGMPVEIITDVYPNRTFPATVNIVYPNIDPFTRTFIVELSIPNTKEKLRPGMFARATFDLYQEDAFIVPSMAVLKLQGSNERYVFLAEDGKAKRVVVELGDRYDDMIEVLSDQIKPGVELVVAGQSRLLNGTPVSIVK